MAMMHASFVPFPPPIPSPHERDLPRSASIHKFEISEQTTTNLSFIIEINLFKYLILKINLNIYSLPQINNVFKSDNLFKNNVDCYKKNSDLYFS